MIADSNPKEIWRCVSGYEGVYQVSNLGRVRSVDRYIKTSIGANTFFRGKVLKHNVHPDGYHVVNLQIAGNIRGNLVSRLVAAAFCGELRAGLEVNHIDGIKANNHAENLEIVTAKENCQHRDRTGLRQPASGSKHGMAKLTEHLVKNIISDLALFDGVSLAKKYNVSPSTISLIRRGRIWKKAAEELRHEVAV